MQATTSAHPNMMATMEPAANKVINIAVLITTTFVPQMLLMTLWASSTIHVRTNYSNVECLRGRQVQTVMKIG